ncbi:MAG: hypothetical protein NTW82_13400 [Bacteroidia bacterium]|nr:hypothetical protein [Bacteroidia bacterium]
MVKKVILTISGFLILSNSFGQVQSAPGAVPDGDRINAARTWAKVNKPDSAFVQLFKLVQDNNYIYYNYLIIISEFNTLQSDQRWDEVIGRTKKNYFRIEGNLDLNLVAILDSIYVDDQIYRIQLNEVEKEYGFNSKEFGSLWKKIIPRDSVNLIRAKKFIDTFGFPGLEVIGSQGITALWLVIQHSDIRTQETYLPLIKDAAKRGDLNAGKLALLEDRVALRQGKKQIYGTQITRDGASGEYYVQPLLDPDNVDKRRAEVGLGKLQDYVSEWGIIWNAEEYKKKLAESESKKMK